MATINAMARFVTAKYDGTNPQDIADVANSVDYQHWTVVESTASRCVIEEAQFKDRTIVPVGHWITRNGFTSNGVYSDEEYAITFVQRRAVVQEAADVSYFGSGVGLSAVSIGIGASGFVNVRVDPPVPAGALADVKFKSIILSASGAAVGQVSVSGTPTVTNPLVPESTVNGVLTPAHTVIRTPIRNVGVGVLTSVQIYTTAHV